MGCPQDRLKFIHVAGTNGKGSFCSMLTEIFLAAGYRVGTYTSPYILRFNERMKVNGKDIPDEILAEITSYVKPLTETMTEKPTEFELITAIAMEYFVREQCDIVILECGMGGRLDSTNVIKTPILSVITGIALDHTAFLGDTLEKIAAEKAGIIKEGVPCLFCGTGESVKEVIESKAKEMSAPLLTVSREGLVIRSATLDGTVFDWKEWKNISLSLTGNYQPLNAQNVLCAVKHLRTRGYDLSNDAVKEGLRNVRWPARFEKVLDDPIFICDGGHNPEGIEAAVNSAKMYFGDRKILIVTGVMADKDYDYMVSCLSQIAKKAYCLTPGNPRALNAQDLAHVFVSKGVPASPFPTPKDAVAASIEDAKADGDAILCVGSLYMYSQIIDSLNEMKII
jgi:dihydrofolate synthase/folylpolyglutamate synthase